MLTGPALLSSPNGHDGVPSICVVTANFFPDLIATFCHFLIVSSFTRLDTGLVIHHPDVFLSCELLMRLLLLQHIKHALAGFDFLWRAFSGINTGAVSFFQT